MAEVSAAGSSAPRRWGSDDALLDDEARRRLVAAAIRCIATSPVDQFVEHCWVAPFVEDSVEDLAGHLPIDRIVFGSDWPHAEGMAHPRDLLANVESFPPEAQRRIMAENGRELTFA